LEPQCHHAAHAEAGKVCSVVIGLTAEDGQGNSAYIDGTYQYPEGKCVAVSTFKSNANKIVSQFAADQGWVASLDSQIEAMKLRNVSPEDFEAPEITVDTTVKAAEGSPANPTPEPEEESTEEGSEESEE
tara:strand:+ start:189 stop:578 length:390 start_codon:yes stop_codon:yes gene_type:complete